MAVCLRATSSVLYAATETQCCGCSLSPNFRQSDLENGLWQFARELKYFGVNLELVSHLRGTASSVSYLAAAVVIASSLPQCAFLGTVLFKNLKQEETSARLPSLCTACADKGQGDPLDGVWCWWRHLPERQLHSRGKSVFTYSTAHTLLSTGAQQPLASIYAAHMMCLLTLSEISGTSSACILRYC